MSKRTAVQPQHRPTAVLVAAVAFMLSAVPGAAQGGPATAGPFRLLPAAEEEALARSAAPSEVSADATVYVLTAGGFEKTSEGTNGVSCVVSRDHPESLYPICYDREAARTILPTEFFEVQQRIAGVDEDAIGAEVARRFGTGEFRVPTRGALTWMMSPEQVLYAGAAGRRVGPWHPHVMIYIPGATVDELGIAGMVPTGDFQVALPGTPRAHLVIHTARWADGTPHTP